MNIVNCKLLHTADFLFPVILREHSVIQKKKMRVNKYIASLLLVGILLGFGCKKIWEGNDGTPRNPNLPYVTSYVDSTSDTSATVTVVVKNGGGNPSIKSQGLCWSTSPNPTIKLNNEINDTTIIVYDSSTQKKDTVFATTFSISIKGLSPKTTYYVRAFANNQKDSTGLSYANQLTITTPASSPYSLGQYYNGGYIFYIDTATGLHGLVCDTADLSYTLTDTSGNITKYDSIPWCIANSNNVFLGNGTAIGSGFANTLAILTTFDSLASPNFDSLSKQLPAIAAFVCRYSHNGDTTWYLPTKDELNLMYNNLAVRGYGNFTQANYWSSSDYLFDGKVYAWAQYFVDGNQYYFRQTLPLYVRAVRKF